MYLIRIQANHSCWIADVAGDPGRTLVKSSAKVYEAKISAVVALMKLRQEYPNRAFKIERLRKLKLKSFS